MGKKFEKLKFKKKLVSNCIQEIGNTSRSPDAKHWCFTYFHYGIPSDFETLIKPHSKVYIFQEELSTSGSMHLQGYIEFNNKIRAIEKYKHLNIHWEVCRSPKHSIQYCQKNDTRCGKLFTNIEILQDPMEGLELYHWQKIILEIISEPANRRTINWFYDKQGNAGKTTFAFHLCMKYNALYVNGKASDIKYAVGNFIKENKLKIVIFNYTRSLEEYVSYEALESVKDGIFFNNKYESQMTLMNPIHVIVFANFKPNINALSADRWNIVNINMYI